MRAMKAGFQIAECSLSSVKRYKITFFKKPIGVTTCNIRRSHPAQSGEDRFGPPTLERSGSEHRRAVTSPLPEEEGLGEKVELSLQERRRGRKNSFFNGKEGREGFRKQHFL